MGFDPRQQQRVTTNIDALLGENDALRREVERLQRELERLRAQQSQWSQPKAKQAPKVSRQQVLRWGEALQLQPGWQALCQTSLNTLIERLNRRSFPSHLNLQQRLDRLAAGLGTDLVEAVGDQPTTESTAVLAAFALYGIRASEWLDEDPRRVVIDLNRYQQQRPVHNQSAEALAVLGLAEGASLAAIKRAHRRLAKLHHPDMGGSAESFRRINEAYQQLVIDPKGRRFA